MVMPKIGVCFTARNSSAELSKISYLDTELLDRRYYNKEAIDAMSLGGGGAVVPANLVVMDPIADEVEGESYQTLAAAFTYIATQTPSITNRWGVTVSGTVSESFTLPAWTSVIGNGVARLTGAITGQSFGTNSVGLAEYNGVRYCEITSPTVGSMNELYVKDCLISGGTLSGQTGLYVFDSVVTSLDIAQEGMLMFKRSVVSGITAASMGMVYGFNSIVKSGGNTINYGAFEECYIKFGNGDTLGYSLTFVYCPYVQIASNTTIDVSYVDDGYMMKPGGAILEFEGCNAVGLPDIPDNVAIKVAGCTSLSIDGIDAGAQVSIGSAPGYIDVVMDETTAWSRMEEHHWDTDNITYSAGSWITDTNETESILEVDGMVDINSDGRGPGKDKIYLLQPGQLRITFTGTLDSLRVVDRGNVEVSNISTPVSGTWYDIDWQLEQLRVLKFDTQASNDVTITNIEFRWNGHGGFCQLGNYYSNRDSNLSATNVPEAITEISESLGQAGELNVSQGAIQRTITLPLSMPDTNYAVNAILYVDGAVSSVPAVMVTSRSTTSIQVTFSVNIPDIGTYLVWSIRPYTT